MLVKRIEDLRAHTKVASTLEWGDVQGSVKLAEERYVVNLISATEYNSLSAAYEANVALTLKQSNLLTRCQDAIANLAMWLYVNKGRGQVNGTGITADAKKDASKSLEQWSMYDLKDQYGEDGFAFLDILLDYLETNKNVYTDWTASESYTVFKESIISTVDQFDGYVKINRSRRLFLALKPKMKRVERDVIVEALTKPLYEDLKTKLKEKTALNDAETTVVELAREALALLTMAGSVLVLKLTLDDNGYFSFETTKTNTVKGRAIASPVDIAGLIQSLQGDAASTLATLSKFIEENFADLPGYTPPTTEAIAPIDQTDKNIYLL